MDDDDVYLEDIAEAAAKEAFELLWAESLHGEFEDWQKEAVEHLFCGAFSDGAIFYANVSSTKLPLLKPDDKK